MSNQKTERTEEANSIIQNHIMWSMGAGLIPVLIADVFAVSALQLDMIRQLCKVYDIDFQETQGKAIVTSLTSTALARLGAGSIIKLIPGVGTLLGGVTVSAFAGASTYALGEVFKKHFESGGTILDFDPDRLRKYYHEKFEKGKKMAKKMKKEAEATAEPAAEQSTPQPKPAAQSNAKAAPKNEGGLDVLARLKELGELKNSGVISEEEFDIMKKKLIDEF